MEKEDLSSIDFSSLDKKIRLWDIEHSKGWRLSLATILAVPAILGATIGLASGIRQSNNIAEDKALAEYGSLQAAREHDESSSAVSDGLKGLAVGAVIDGILVTTAVQYGGAARPKEAKSSES